MMPPRVFPLLLSEDVTIDTVDDGCWRYNPMLDNSTYYKLFTTPEPMSVTNCKANLMAEVPPYTMFTLSGENCYLSNSSYLNETISPPDEHCQEKCPSSTTEVCGKSDRRAILYGSNFAEFDANDCEDNLTLCNADRGQGICVDTKGGHICKCDPSYSGTECQTAKVDPCLINLCSANSRCVADTSSFTWTYSCKCDPGYSGNYCQYASACITNPCLHGGTCVDGTNGAYTCECLQYYSGTNCETTNKCEYANDCVNGTCVPVIDRTIPGNTCSCIPGYTGVLCDELINYCTPDPCLNGTCTPFYLGYNCSCYVGVTGKNCDFTMCSVALTIVWSPDRVHMLEDLLSNPSQIKDMVPFIVGLQEGDSRENISWDYGDLFHWAAFEEKPLVLERDLYKWNDVVLGNCFTFNHRLGSMDYMMRSSGIQGGLQVFMSVGSNEYAPWYDTASILVFIHNKYEYVFSESVRYNAQPNGETLIQVRDVRRLLITLLMKQSLE
ncbi:EGF-like domain protein [Cooperia oncophora]